jgi:hypothetical protein
MQFGLRLQAARRLMLGEDFDATSEYKSLFGDPPMRDIQRLREAASDFHV